jgi:hypothetical protein
MEMIEGLLLAVFLFCLDWVILLLIVKTKLEKDR